MHEQFAEVEENLLLKSKLVENLSAQLERSARERQLSAEQRQKEREIYQQRYNTYSWIFLGHLSHPLLTYSDLI